MDGCSLVYRVARDAGWISEGRGVKDAAASGEGLTQAVSVHHVRHYCRGGGGGSKGPFSIDRVYIIRSICIGSSGFQVVITIV